MKGPFAYCLFLITGLLFSCRTDQAKTPLLTENVIIVVVDGARYSETWGDADHQHIPNLSAQVASNGFVCTSFRNNGPTYTTAGHSAITTGHYQEINNAGLELPDNPSIFQYYLKETGKDSTKAWVIASKDKLSILGNTTNADWFEKFMPSTDCGLDGGGAGSGQRTDSATYVRTIEILETYHPNLVLINFREPDYSGHQGNWNNYLKGIEDTDQYIGDLWNYLQADSLYNGKTTLLVTNDHGRHLDTISSGFSGHGDDCEECRHINLFGIGPDFREGVVSSTAREQIDIPVLVAHLLGFDMNGLEGSLMNEVMK